MFEIVGRGDWYAEDKSERGDHRVSARGRKYRTLLIHPGGPFWAKKDAGRWSIPKGLYQKGEDALVAAKRVFGEATGFVPVGPFIELGAFRQPSRKVISVWAVENDFDLIAFRSNMFSMEWPPKSGRMREFPEADRAQWFSVDEARHKITEGQIPIVDALAQRFQWRALTLLPNLLPLVPASSFAAAKLPHWILKFLWH
jgi:predicted NUDIX family NTP pyrophosphohydrolase